MDVEVGEGLHMSAEGVGEIRIERCPQSDYEIEGIKNSVRSLIVSGAKRVVVKIPSGGFTDCVDVIRALYTSFFYISLEVHETEDNGL